MSQSISSRYRSGRRGSRSWLAEPDDCDYVVKAVLLGDPGVGKTSFFRAYLHQGGSSSGATASSSSSSSFCGPHTCCSYYGPAGKLVPGERGAGGRQANGQKVVRYCGKRVGVTLWDTAGQERYRSLTASYYRGAHACIVLYDALNEQSFDNVYRWLDSVLDYRDTTSTAGTHTVLVGNTRSAVSSQNTTTSTTDNTTTAMGISNHSSSRGTCKPSVLLVDKLRAQNLAAHYQIPLFQVDIQDDPHGVAAVMDSVVSQVMSKALDSLQLSRSGLAARLVDKTRQTSCFSCCPM